MKRPLELALWCDCENDQDRALLLRSGRAHESGIVAKAVADDLARALEELIAIRSESAKGQEDARLGRMVRRMKVDESLHRDEKGWTYVDLIIDGEGYSRGRAAPTPEKAMEDAGYEEAKG